MEKDLKTVEEIGPRAFCLQEIKFSESEGTLLDILIREDNEVKNFLVPYAYPPDFEAVVAALAEATPIHMCGFQDGLLADARSIWGYVCPCSQS